MPGDTRTERIEYLTWISDDPHSGSYETLFSSDSQRMLALLDKNVAPMLRGEAGPSPGDMEKRYVEALDENGCIHCHATRGPTVAKIARETLWSDGVSCEACHGAAESYLDEHYKLASEPAGLTGQQKKSLGMQDTEGLVARAGICVDCHVGSPGRDVNHDLIAAGHPQLKFEFSSYMRRLPKHWTREQDREWSRPDYAVRSWSIGHVVTLQSALSQLARRAAPAGVWPEFAEVQCGACHHDLGDEALRQDRAANSGPFAWNSWYHGLLANRATASSVVRHFDANQSETVSSRIEGLRRMMSVRSPPADEVAERAAALAQRLERLSVQLAGESSIDDQSISEWMLSLSDSEPRGWDEAAQIYIALIALEQTYRVLAADGPRRRSLAEHITNLHKILTTDARDEASFLRNQDDVTKQLESLHEALRK